MTKVVWYPDYFGHPLLCCQGGWVFFGNVYVPFLIQLQKQDLQIPKKSHVDLLTVITFCKSSPQVFFLLTEKRKKGNKVTTNKSTEFKSTQYDTYAKGIVNITL